ITELLEDSRGAIWAGGPEGLARFDRDRWELVTPLQQREAAGVFGLFEEPDGSLLVGLPGEVQRRDPQTGRFEVISEDARVRSFVIDDGGSLWATSLTEAITRMRAGGTGSAPFVPDWKFPTATPGAVLFYDNRKNLWLGTFGAGLLRLRDGRLMERLTTREGMTNDVVRAVFEDREGNIWAGTQSGLNRLSPSVITTALDDQNPLVNVSRAVISDGSGGVWIGTVGGLYHLTDRGQTRFGRAEGLPGDSVGALFLDGHGTLWIVTDGGVARSDGARFETLP